METIQIGELVFTVVPEVVETPKKEPRAVPKPTQKVRARKPVSQAKQIFALAKMHGYENVRKVGQGALIDHPIETNGWLVMPPDMYQGIIPRKALEAAETLTKGIRIKGLLIAEDKRSIERKPQIQALQPPFQTPDWGKIATVVGRVAAAGAIVGAVIAFLPLVLSIGAIGIALSYDPLLIAVTEEEEWICLYEWWD